MSAQENLYNEYLKKQLLEKDASPNPIVQFALWYEDWLFTKPIEGTAMILATATSDGKPSARAVLLKGFTEQGFTFFTNYESRKGTELNENPFASLLFLWKEIHRQVRIEGKIKKVSKQKSEEYFRSRPLESQLGTWASRQSKVLTSREELDKRLEELKKQYSGKEIPLPPYWGGYLLIPESIEFWQGRPNRMHDRLLYTKDKHDWKIERLAP